MVEKDEYEESDAEMLSTHRAPASRAREEVSYVFMKQLKTNSALCAEFLT